MPSALPLGDPVPADGSLPAERAGAGWGRRPFGLLRARAVLHGRGAATATSTPTPPIELRRPGVSRATYAEPAIAEVRLARRVLGDATCRSTRSSSAAAPRPCCRPTTWRSIARRDRGRVRPGRRRRDDDRGQPRQRRRWTTCASCARAASTGSRFGMQSAVAARARDPRPHPRPGAGPAVVGWAREAGFEQVSLDLIYGTPGESLDDWRASLEAALACGPDHVSAYSLIVEDGTALARRVRRGEIADARRGRPRRQVPAGRRAAREGRPELVRGLQLGHRRGPALPAQHALLDRRRLVGRRPRRAQPRRRRPVVERQAPRGVRRPHRPPSRARPRPARCSTRRDRRVERVLLELRLPTACPADVLDDDGPCRRPGAGTRAVWSPSPTTRSSSPRPAGCSPTRWSETCSPEPIPESGTWS